MARAINASEAPIRKRGISGYESIDQEVVLKGNNNNKVQSPSNTKLPCSTYRRNEMLTSKKKRRRNSFGDERD